MRTDIARGIRGHARTVAAALLWLTACNHAGQGRSMTAGDVELKAITVKWPAALKKRWEQRVKTVDWMRRQLVVGALASAAAVEHGLPTQLSLHVHERLDDLRWRVHFGRMTADGQSFVATHQISVTDRKTSYQALPSPRVLSGSLGARARAVVTAKTYLDRRSAGWASRLQKKHGAWFNHLVRARPDGRIDVYLVAFSQQKHRVILGGDYHFLISKDGARVLVSRSLHSGVIVVEMKAGQDPVVMHHIHDARTGDLPTATDLLKLQQSPYLRGLVVIGPRYTLHLVRHPSKPLWETILLDSKKYRRLLKSQK